MQLSIELPSLSFELDMPHGFALLTGPNGVGKSQILEALAHRNAFQSSSVHLRFAGQSASASLGGRRLDPVLITTQDLNSAAIPHGKPPSKEMDVAPSLTPSQVVQAIKAEQSRSSNFDPTMQPRTAALLATPILQFLTAEEKQHICNGTRAEQETILRSAEIRRRSAEIRGRAIQLPALLNAFSDYHRWYARFVYRGMEDKEILDQLGPAPWDRFHAVLDELAMPYRFDTPSLRHDWPDEFEFVLRRSDNGSIVDGGMLSAGERVLLRLCELLLASHAQRGKLFLFDDIDGLLHPPMLKRFVNIVQDKITRDWGSPVIWATHSPVLAQIANNARLYYVREFGAVPVPIARTELVQRLSGGELIVRDNTNVVFVEGLDHEFYNRLFLRLQFDGRLNVRRSVQFVSPKPTKHSSDAGHHAVEEIVQVLTRNGFAEMFAGLVDCDSGTSQLPKGVRRIGRYSIENYWLDPLNIYGWLLDNRFDMLPSQLHFTQITEGMSSQMLHRLDTHQKQQIVDFWSGYVAENWDQSKLKESPDLNQREEVRIYGCDSLLYPSFMLRSRGKEIINRIISQYVKGMNKEKLREHFLRGAFWPCELVEVMQSFTTESSRH